MVNINNPNCTCDEHEHDYHECPFAVDVHDDDTECDCCPSCTQTCADDI